MIDAEVLNAEQFSFASKPICLELRVKYNPYAKNSRDAVSDMKKTEYVNSL